MGAALADLLLCLRRDVTRALSILCLVGAACVECSPYVIAAIAIVVVILCLDTLQINRAARTLRAIAEGDRFVAFPKTRIDSWPCRAIAAAGERMRRDLVAADAAIADQRRLLAEVRIRRQGDTFFTTRFHDSVAQAFSSFAQRGNEICDTVHNLSTFNSGLLRDAHSVSDAVTDTASDVRAVSQAATQIAGIVATMSEQIAASDTVTRSTLADLMRARDTIERLKRASDEISTFVGIIHSVASQTSLLALNATIEAARAGEKGLGFAIVASEVKALATRSGQATTTISAQIEDIQAAVADTSSAIDAIMGRVDSLAVSHGVFAASMAQSTTAIEEVGAKANTVAGRVSDAMPNLAAGVGEIEMAGRSVLENARMLMDGSERLVTSFKTYFQDLTSGAIKVGILHSLSGTVTAAERPLHDLLIGLIEDTNRHGGLLGRPLEAVIANPRSEPSAYGEGARQLIEQGAAVIFGCWTSQSRLETIPVLESADSLLFYPSQYEGGEASPAVVYAGGTPQQQAWPAVDFLVGAGRPRLVLVGGASVYSLGTHALIKRYAETVGATVVLDLQVQEATANWSRIAAEMTKIEGRERLAVVTTLTGDASVAFFRAMARHDMGAGRLPMLSLSIGEAEMSSLDAAGMAGNYVAWNYLHGLRGEANEIFVETWRRLTDNPQAVANDALAATYTAFRLWTMAVAHAGSTRTAQVRAALQGLSTIAPSGFRIRVTPDQHLTLPAFVGQIQADGSIVPVWASQATRDPEGRQQQVSVAA